MEAIMTSFFTVEKKKIRKSLGIDYIQLKYKNFEIDIEIELEYDAPVVFRFTNEKIKTLKMTKSLDTPIMLTIDYFVDDNKDRICELQEELTAASEIIQHGAELDEMVHAELDWLKKDMKSFQ